MSNISHRQAHTNTKLKIAEAINNRWGISALAEWTGSLACTIGALDPNLPPKVRIGLGLGSVVMAGVAVQETTIALSPEVPDLVAATTPVGATVPSQRQAPSAEQIQFAPAPVVAEL